MPEREKLSLAATDPEEALRERLRMNLRLTHSERLEQHSRRLQALADLRRQLRRSDDEPQSSC